jgi:hypothetical protein
LWQLFLLIILKISYLAVANSCNMKSITLCVLLIFSTFYISNSYSQTPVPAGQVSGTWTLTNSPYQIQGEISIVTGQTLLINPGVIVEFEGHFKFNVQGSLLAQGTMTDSIRFTIYDTTGFHDVNIPDERWHGIRFGFGVPGVDSSRLSYCSFTYGKAMGSANLDKSGGAVGVYEYDNLVIANSTFIINTAQQSGGAVAMANASIIL